MRDVSIRTLSCGLMTSGSGYSRKLVQVLLSGKLDTTTSLNLACYSLSRYPAPSAYTGIVHDYRSSWSRCSRAVFSQIRLRLLCKSPSCPTLTQIAFLATTRYPSPLEPLADTALKHFGPAILRAILLSAGSEAPRSVIPNLAELLASFVQRIPGQEVMQWMTTILAEDGFPDPRATPAKPRLKEVVLK